MPNEWYSPVIVDGNPFDCRSTRVSGSTLRELAGIPPDQDVFQDMPGLQEDRQFFDQDVADVPLPLRFYTRPAPAPRVQRMRKVARDLRDIADEAWVLGQTEVSVRLHALSRELAYMGDRLPEIPVRQ